MSHLERLSKLISIRDFYLEEAERCYKCKAYFAACVMLGAVFETSLLIIVGNYPDEVKKSQRVPKDKKGRIKSIGNWKLIELLNVADDLNWLPRGKKYNQFNLEIGDMGDVMRMIRNHIHPANYLSKYPLMLKEDHYYSIFEMLKIMNELLSDKTKNYLVQHLT
jgi:hypothetical protein